MSKSSGVTLVELLVGLTVGAIVIVGVLFSWGLAVRNNAYVLGVTALNNDMRSLMAIVTQDLRRASQDPGRVWRTAEGRTVVIDGSCVVFNPFFTRADDQAALPVTFPSGYRLVNGDFQFWVWPDPDDLAPPALPPLEDLDNLDVRCASNDDNRWQTILTSGDRGIQLNDFSVNDARSVCLEIEIDDSDLSWAESGVTYEPCPDDGETQRIELTLLELTLSGTLALSGVVRDFEFTDVVQLRNYRVLEN